MMVRVKICGITCPEDAVAAATYGADAVGLIFAESRRRVSPDQARRIISELPPLVTTVGVFVNEDPERVMELKAYCGFHLVQLHGDEPEQYVERFVPCAIKSVTMGAETSLDPEIYPAAFLLLDTAVAGARGGTGKTFDWNLAVDVARRRPIILAGGLTPDNVAQAVRNVRPYAVDVAGGVELNPGRKDHEKLARFIQAVRSVE